MIYGWPKNFCNNIYTHILSNAQILISLVCVCSGKCCARVSYTRACESSELSRVSVRGAHNRMYLLSEGIISRLLVNANIPLFFGRSFCNDNVNNNNNNIMIRQGEGAGCLDTI